MSRRKKKKKKNIHIYIFNVELNVKIILYRTFLKLDVSAAKTFIARSGTIYKKEQNCKETLNVEFPTFSLSYMSG